MKDDTQAAMKVRDFEKNNPPRGSGKKRGTYDHVGFNQSYKASSFSQGFNRVKRMGQIEYARLQNHERGWDWARSEKQWKVHAAKRTDKNSDMQG
eukprot:4871335-Pyramimonas_sp.AAC.1